MPNGKSPVYAETLGKLPFGSVSHPSHKKEADNKGQPSHGAPHRQYHPRRTQLPSCSHRLLFGDEASLSTPRKNPRAEPWTHPGRLGASHFPPPLSSSVLTQKNRRFGDAEDVTKAHMDARRPRLSWYFGGNAIGKDATLCKVPNPVADLPQAICEYRRSSPSFISGLSLGRQDTLGKSARHLGEVRWQWLESLRGVEIAGAPDRLVYPCPPGCLQDVDSTCY